MSHTNKNVESEQVRVTNIWLAFFSCNVGEACLLCCPRELAAGAKGHYIPANNSASFFHNDFYSPHISTGSFHIYHCLMYLSCTPVAKWNTVLF